LSGCFWGTLRPARWRRLAGPASSFFPVFLTTGDADQY
jgi:hypothetical protein